MAASMKAPLGRGSDEFEIDIAVSPKNPSRILPKPARRGNGRVPAVVPIARPKPRAI